MTQTSKIVKSGVYVTLSSLGVFLFSYLFRIVLARNFSVAEYGLFYSIWNFLTFFLFFTYLGLDQAVVHYIVKYKVENNFDKIKTAIVSTLFFQLLTTTIFIVIVFVMSPYLEVNYFRFENSAYLLRIMLLFLLFNVLGGISSYIFYGYQKMKTYALYILVQSALYLLLTLLLIQLDWGLSAPFWAYAFSAFLLMIIFLFWSLKIFPIWKYKIVNFKENTKMLFSFGLPVILTAISSRLLIQTDTLMLTRMTSLEQVGLYQAALPLATILTIFGTGVVTVLFPLFTELWQKQEKGNILMYLRAIYKYLFLLTLPLIILMILFSNYLLLWIFGLAYIPAKGALIILALSILFNIFSAINLQSIAAFGYPKTVSKMVLMAAGVNVVLNVVLIPLWGIEGAALATSLSYLLMFLLSLIELKKYVPLRFESSWLFVSWGEVKMLKRLVLGK